MPQASAVAPHAGLRLGATAARGHAPPARSSRRPCFPRRRRLGSLVAALAAGLCVPFLPLAPARCNEPDEVELRLLQDMASPLHWENVEGAPAWVAGTEPSYRFSLGLHVVSLAREDAVVLRLPARSILRLRSFGLDLDAKDVELWVSDGSGLAANVQPSFSAGLHSLLFAPDSGRTQLVEIRPAADRRGPLELALFLSRRDPPPTVVPYRGVLPLLGPRVGLRRADQAMDTHFGRMACSTPVSVAVEGPARLALETRLAYPSEESRPFQTYRITVRIDGAERQSLDFETTAEFPRSVFVDGCERPVGRLEVGTLEVPAGRHLLSFEATAPVYERLLRQEDRDYLVGSLNGPGPGPETDEARDAGAARPGLAETLLASPWRMTEEELRRLGAETAPTATAVRRLSLRLARDNARRDGALAATTLLERLADSRPDAPALRALADDARSFHTFDREVLPSEKRTRAPDLFGWFARRRLRDPGETLEEIALARRQLDDAVSRLGRGTFVALPAGPGQAHEYLLPPRSAPSRLQIAAEISDLPAGHELRVQLDQRPPVRLKVFPSSHAVAVGFVPARAEAGLAALEGLHGGTEGDTCGGAFALENPVGLRLDVGTVELPLPPEVRVARVWDTPGRGNAGPREAVGPTAAPATVRVSLTYGASRIHRLSEMAVLEHARRTELSKRVRAAGLAAALRQLGGIGADETERVPALELANDLLPLVRLLEGNVLTFAASVGPSPARAKVQSPKSDPTAREGEGSLEGAARLARERQGRRDWLGALESWADVARAATQALRSEAQLGKVAALRELGEEALATSQLRGLLLHESDRRTRERALAELLQLRSPDGADDALLEASAVAAMGAEGPVAPAAPLASATPPAAAALAVLADVLRRTGDCENAVRVALLLERSEETARLRLPIALRLGWWRVFEEALADLNGEEERSRWRAQRLAAEGEYAAALSAFQRAGPVGRPFAEAIEEARRVAGALRSADPSRRARAVFAWEAWQARYPGPRVWMDDPGLVTDHAGVRTVRSPGRDLLSSMFLATPEAPVVIRALGPAKLRLLARPLHPAGSTVAVDDWLDVREAAQFLPVPITNDLPTAALELVEDPAHACGRQTATVVELCPGLHELRVSGRGRALLLIVQEERPEFPLGLLPPLTPVTLDAALRGALGAPNRSPTSVLGCVRLFGGPQLERTRTLPILDRPTWPGPRPPAPVGALDPLLATRLALRTGGPLPAGLFESDSPLSWGPAGEAGDFPDAERILAYGRWRAESQAGVRKAGDGEVLEPAGDGPASVPELAGAPAPMREALALARGDLEGALALPLGEGDAAVARRMALLAHVAETRAEQRGLCVALANRLFAEKPRVPGLQELVLRIDGGAQWELVTTPLTSAGVRSIDREGWHPEAPGLRVRRALLPPLSPQEQVVSGDDRLGIAMTNLRPAELLLHLSIADVEYMAPVGLRAEWQVGDRKPESVLLTPAVPTRSIRLTAPLGRQALRVRIVEPVANQFLRVRIVELRPPERTGVADGGVEAGKGVVEAPLLGRVERVYQLATASQPVKVSLAGPAWLRLDEGVDGETRSRYRLVLGGWQTVSFAPEAGRAEMLCRVFRLGVRAGAVPPPPRRTTALLPAVPPPWLELRAEAAQADLSGLGDRYALGGQEDATWSVGLRGEQRRLLSDNDLADGLVPDRFLELRAARRVFDEDRRLFSGVEVLGRTHEVQAATVGLRGYLRYSPESLPLALAAETTGYLQAPEGALPGKAGGVEWSLSVRGSVSQRLVLGPKVDLEHSLTFFGRALSLHQNNHYAGGELDEDVFTLYKAQHRSGAELSETLLYRPWLDSVWSGGASLVSNEGVFLEGPDRLDLEAGARQLLGPVEVAVGYKAALSFEDENRVKAVLRRSVTVGAAWELHRGAETRLELEGRYRHDFDPVEDSGFLMLTWREHHGRGYRDLPPGEVGFRDLRESREQRETRARERRGE
ncbi:MAG: hypothetical protein HYZ53_06265 [Planctomycetes bacterium]|nr:hypothetical protein [Planctomycetota bacterium]